MRIKLEAVATDKAFLSVGLSVREKPTVNQEPGLSPFFLGGSGQMTELV